MIGILLAAATAVLWGISGLVGAMGARRVGGVTLALWTFPVGLLLAVPALAIAERPAHPASLDGIAGIVGAFVAVAALGLAFRAGGAGHAGLASSVVSLEGVLAALIGAAIGLAPLRTVALPSLALAAFGFVLLTAPGDRGGGQRLRTVVTAFCAALGFGISLNCYAAGGDAFGAVGQTIVVRIVGSLVVVGLLFAGRLRVPRGTWPLVVCVATTELVGTITWIAAAGHVGVGVASVISSQFALVTLVLGWLVLHEGLTRRQRLAALLILVGVATFTAIQA